MKKLYFVRHAESTGNIGDIRQGPSTPLSPEGEKQAQIVAERFKTIPIDKIIVSTYVRAKQTADYINVSLGKDIEYSDLLVERIKPSSVVGKSKSDPETIRIDKLSEDNFHDPLFKFEDGETFSEMKRRALDVLRHVENLPEEKILCVSHGIFMKMILACVIHGDDLTSYEYWDIYRGVTLANTGITLFEQYKYDDRFRWKLKIWGDVAHLGDTSMREGDSW